MAVHFTYLDHIIPQTDGGVVIPYATEQQKLLFAALIAICFIILGKLLVSRIISINSAPTREDIIPPRKPGLTGRPLFGFLDFLMESFISYQDSIAGKENRKHAPFTASIFFFIFVLNLLGLIPGMPAAVTTVWVNVAMAIVVFIHFNFYGIKEHGFVGYLKHFTGPILVLAPLMLAIELISLSMRILTLNLRLYWNIVADHVVLGIFADLLSGTYIMAAPFYIIGLFVAFMQAFVFATLTMIYIVLATQHEDEH